MLRTTYLHSNWEFLDLTKGEGTSIGVSKTEWLPASVPGHVHLDLIAQGVIADPFERMNELGCQWVDEHDWSYRTHFDWTPTEGVPYQLLRFEGLDTVCAIFLNGERIAENDNMFVPLEIDVAALLKEGANELRIDFQSAARVGDERSAPYYEREGLIGGKQFFERAFVRKAQYMYGWDWGPRLVSCGIWRPVSLIEFSARFLDTRVQPRRLSDGTAEVSFTADVQGEAEGWSVSLFDPNGEEIEGVSEGNTTKVLIQEPELWETGTRSEPMLYEAEFTLFVSDGNGGLALADRKNVRVGIRDIEFKREKDEFGESFEFYVNGKPLWIRGANWIPDHSFPSAISPRQYREQIERALDMGCNMLRVWGGGLYETDEFYDICDELGMLVWQDFPFACSFYPDDEHWQEVVYKEASVNVRRLRNHPSLAIWCGSNENYQMFYERWKQDNTPDRFYGEHLYLKAIPKALQENDPDRPYTLSSAIGASDDPTNKVNQGGVGDSHYWDVWHGRGDWRFYADSTARFSSEFGFVSACSMEAWKGVFPGEENASAIDFRSPAVRWHDKTGKGYEKYVDLIELHYPAAKDLGDWVYYSQLNQRDALRFGVEHFRRSEFCKGTIIWQINDCWPVQSWAFLDFAGNYKALGYELRRLYADVLVSIVRDNDQVQVWAINDGDAATAGELKVQAVKLADGSVLREWQEKVAVDPFSRKSILEFSISGLATPDVILQARYEAYDLEEPAESWLLLSEPKSARLAAPAPITISKAYDGYIALSTTAPVVDLALSSDGSLRPFLENFVTILKPGITYIACSEAPDKIEARSLAGTHRVTVTRSPL